jgi:hypothetical protein
MPLAAFWAFNLSPPGYLRVVIRTEQDYFANSESQTQEKNALSSIIYKYLVYGRTGDHSFAGRSHQARFLTQTMGSLVSGLLSTTDYAATGSLWWLILLHIGLPLISVLAPSR